MTAARMLSFLFLLPIIPSPGAAAAGGGVDGPVIEVVLDADLAHASLRQAEIVRLLIRAADIMEALYRQQVAPGGFYPEDMTREEFEAWDDPAARSPYTRIRRDDKGLLEAVPYHEAWPRELGQVARLLAQAGATTIDEALRHYLHQRARALITGDYTRVEAAWRQLGASEIDVLIGPVGTEADREFGLKAAFGAYVLLRDWAWGARMAQFKVFLPQVQHSLPVSDAFKAEVPEVGRALAVYDLIYHAGYGAAHANALQDEAAGDWRVSLQQGPRRLPLRNVMEARFAAQVLPVAAALLANARRERVDFEAFFMNAMFQQMGHGLGLRQTIDGRHAVHAALGAHAEMIEEAKAAVLGQWLVDWLHARGELSDAERADHHASFLAGVLHAIHLDAWGAGGRARLLVFNHLRDWGAFRRDPASSRYHVDEDSLGPALASLAAQLLTIQGSGDHDGAAALIESVAVIRPELHDDLAALGELDLPRVIVFRQGEHLLGL